MNQQPKQSLIQQQIQYWQASDHVSPEGTGCHPSEAARNQNNKLEKKTRPNPTKNTAEEQDARTNQPPKRASRHRNSENTAHAHAYRVPEAQSQSRANHKPFPNPRSIMNNANRQPTANHAQIRNQNTKDNKNRETINLFQNSMKRPCTAPTRLMPLTPPSPKNSAGNTSPM
jgi:hypothetical protein